MILFINGFEMDDWAVHESQVRKTACYTAFGYVGGSYFPGLVSKVCLPLNGSFEENKKGNVYSPARDITYGAPYYHGKQMHYWDPVKKLLSDGFRDHRLFFINGSSDNRTTGHYRYAVGEKIGNEILKNWEWLDNFSKTFTRLGEMKYETMHTKNLSPSIKDGLINYFEYTTDQLRNELSHRNASFSLQPNETLKIIGHSMGAAMSAGVAAAIAKHPIYGKRVEVVLYLAPHQPQDFVHPSQVNGYQSSSKEDLIASKNDINIPMAAGDSEAIAMYNLFNPKNPLPYTVDVPVSIRWGKGTTAYQRIKNISEDHFIQNVTHNLSSMNGHSVGTYNDEIIQFFKIYRNTSAVHR